MKDNFDKISHAIQYIDNHLDEELTVEMIVAKFSFSPYYFHRMFTSIVGKSLIAYIRDRRILYAYKMLFESDQSILVIALNCGFNSAQGFSRSFKSEMGLSPSAYRREHKACDIVAASDLVKLAFNYQIYSGTKC